MNRRPYGAASRARDRKKNGELASLAAYQAAVAVTASEFGVDKSEIEKRSGDVWYKPSNKLSVARRTAIYLAVVVFDRPMRSVARVAGYTGSGALKAIRAIEDRRDDEQFDQTLEKLTLELAA